MTILLSLAVGFILGLLALIFAFQNNEMVSLTFLQWNFESSLAVVVIMSLLAGVLIAILLSIPGAIARTVNTHILRKENASLKDMVTRQGENVPAPVSETSLN